MDLTRLTDQQLRRELRIAMQNYLYILHNFTTDELPPHEISVMKDDLLGKIFDEFKRRRQVQ